MKALPKVIYVMGAPGSGKGTQAKLLAGKIGYHQFSTGSAFREVSQQSTEIGQKVKNLIDNGLLCPPELAAEVVMAAITDHLKQNKGLVFDGTPRTIEEANIVDDFFLKNNYGRPLAIYLEVDQEEMARRNSKRRFCLGISGDFPVITGEDEQKCLTLGGTVGMRPDDDPEKFSTRWNEFKTRTWPVIEQYTEQGILHRVNGQQSIAEVETEVQHVLKQFNEA